MTLPLLKGHGWIQNAETKREACKVSDSVEGTPTV